MILRVFYILLALAGLVAAIQIYRIVLTDKQVAATPASYTAGAATAEADLEVVEFIDYSCPFCQQIHPTITEAVRRDGKVRYIPKPLPTDNRRSMNAAIIAYTAGRQGKFIEMHNALISDFPNLSDDKLTRVAVDLGLNEEQFNKDMQDPSVQKELHKNAALYSRFNTGATPTFLIGKIIYVPTGTMPTVDDFLRMFNEARAQQ